MLTVFHQNLSFVPRSRACFRNTWISHLNPMLYRLCCDLLFSLLSAFTNESQQRVIRASSQNPRNTTKSLSHAASGRQKVSTKRSRHILVHVPAKQWRHNKLWRKTKQCTSRDQNTVEHVNTTHVSPRRYDHCPELSLDFSDNTQNL